MRLVKCKCCGNQIDKEIAYNHVTYDKNFKAKNNYYCNQKEYDNLMLEKEKRKEVFSLIELIFGRKITNSFLNKEITSIGNAHTYNKLCEFINENLMDLSVAVSRNFASEYAEIKYFTTILGNQINDFEIQEEKEEVEFNIEYVKTTYKPKKIKKTINDYMEEYIDE